MSTNCNSSILTLPMELIYHILDQLDTKDILFSFRNVCTYFYAITNSYNRYKIRFTGTTVTSDIHRMCRIIRPENVTSLALISTCSGTDQIRIFFSLIDIQRFTRLHSLDIFNINKDDLDPILRHIITVPSLKSLQVREDWVSSMSNEQSRLLSSLIIKSNVRKLSLDSISRSMYDSIESNQCNLETLSIDLCNAQQLCGILHRLPQLRAFSSNHCNMDPDHQITLPTSFHLLTSLSLRSTNMTIQHLEALLSRTPSLVNLHISRSYADFDFLQRLSQWEQFIYKALPVLQNFKFYVNTQNYDYENLKGIEPIINKFRTSFWLKHKCWYVACKYINDGTRSDVMLYSPPDLQISFPDNLPLGILSYYTCTTTDDDITQTNSIWSVRLNLSEMLDAISSDQLRQPPEHMFQQINRLALDIDWPIGQLSFLSTLFDLSQLIELHLFLSNYHYFEANTLNDLLDLAYNVRILGLSYDDDSKVIPEDICSVISSRIKHLQVRTVDIKCMQLILEHIEHLSSVTFIHHQCLKRSWTDMIQWLAETGRKFTQSNDCRSLQVWLQETSN